MSNGGGRSRPEVSVVVPTHDRRDILPLTLRSIFEQRGVDFEVIVVDDGSTDGTSAAVDALGDRRVRLVRHERPLGVSAARNRGIEEALGEWLAFCDDDDLWAPMKLARQLAVAHEARVRWVIVGHVDVTPRLRVVGGEPPPPADEVVRLLSLRNVVPGGGSGVIVHREVLGRVGGFDPRLRNTEDWELWLRLAATGPPGVVPEPLVAYRLQPGGGSYDDAAMLEDAALIERIHGIRISRAALHRYLAWWALRAGRRSAALGHFVRGLRHSDTLVPAGAFGSDLAYLLRDTIVAVPTRGRSRARTREQLADPVVTWRRTGQAWVDRLAGSAGG